MAPMPGVNGRMRRNGEEDKKRLQDAFESHGKKRTSAPARAPVAAPSAPRPPRDPRQELIDELVTEIKERQEFMEQMQAAGRGHEFDATIKAEIAQRLTRVREIEAAIRADEQ